MAGTINLALTQQFDMDGRPLSGGLLYFFVAATTTPQTAFQDTALTIPWPNPIVLDASGRVPMFYLADGNIKIRLTDKNGVVVIAADNLLVIGPSAGGGGGGGGVDPTTVAQTGDIKARFGTGQLTGFVRCNGLTVGNATSGATERANADTQPLFEYLWATAVLPVTPTRGASATADYNANKQIALPDLRGRCIAGLDDMGSTQAFRLTAQQWGANGGITALGLGNAGGDEKSLIVANNLPAHVHAIGGSTTVENTDHAHAFSGTTSGQNVGHTHDVTVLVTGGVGGTAGPTGLLGASTTITSSGPSSDHSHTFGGTTGGITANHTHQLPTNTGNNTTTGAQLRTAMHSMVMTFYIKL